MLRRYIPGPGVDQRVLMITCGSSMICTPSRFGADTYAYTADRLGHVVAVTHTRTGAIERYVYSPYGVELRGDESGTVCQPLYSLRAGLPHSAIRPREARKGPSERAPAPAGAFCAWM